MGWIWILAHKLALVFSKDMRFSCLINTKMKSSAGYIKTHWLPSKILPLRSKTITKKVADSIQICCKPAKAYRLVYFLRNIDGNKDGKIWGEFYVEFPFNMIWNESCINNSWKRYSLKTSMLILRAFRPIVSWLACHK